MATQFAQDDNAVELPLEADSLPRMTDKKSKCGRLGSRVGDGLPSLSWIVVGLELQP